MEKRNLDRTAKQKEMMLKALEANYGNVSKAAKLIKITTITHYRWLKEDSDYASQAENLRDISYRNVKDHLMDAALKMVDKGNAFVLNRMLGIYFKYMPDDMRIISRLNNVPTRVNIKWVNTPVDPTRTDHLIPKEERDRMLGKGE